jgi:4-amino-4-deoxy-L-arabinose transferase-like glycosyltransferase
MRSVSQAAIAAVVLLGSPAFNRIAAFQTADIPLSYFFLAAVVLFILAYHENSKGALLLAGLMSALAAWTKNEGLPFLVIVTLSTLLILVPRQNWYGFISFILGATVPLITLVLFKIYMPFANDLFADNGLSAIFSKIFDPTRYLAILKSLTFEFSHLGEWPVSIIVVLAIYGLIVGVAHYQSAAERSVVAILGAQFLVYVFIYLITPNELDWQLTYSANRLLLQIFPLMLLSYFLYIQIPDRSFSQNRPR